MTKYRQIEAHLRRLIAESELDTLLPTISELQEQFQTDGVQTVRDAYAPLVDEGLVEVQYRPYRRYVLIQKPEPGAEATSAQLGDRIEEIETILRQGLRKAHAIRSEDYFESFDHTDTALITKALTHLRDTTDLTPEATSRSHELEQIFIQRDTGYQRAT